MRHKLVLEIEVEAENMSSQLDIVCDIESKLRSAVERRGSRLVGWGFFPLPEEEGVTGGTDLP